MIPAVVGALFIMAAAPAVANQQTRIVGGADAPAGRTWQVSIGDASYGAGAYVQHFCGGTVINSTWVLTAAHCVVDTNGNAVAPTNLRVTAGTQDLNAGGETVGVTAVYVHAGYNTTTMVNDIALLNLSSALGCISTTCAPVPLMTSTLESTTASVGTAATITGWGTMAYNTSTYPNVLREVQVPIVSAADCATAYPGQITTEMMCAGYTAGGKDSCQGDSGGPMVVANGSGGYLLAGVVSWGYQCAAPNYPGVYTRVSSYKCWIDQTMGGSCGDSGGSGGGGPLHPIALLGLFALVTRRALRTFVAKN